MSFDIFFQNAVALHQAGRLDEAERIYRSLSDIAPENADLLHLIGLIAVQKGAADSALPYLYKAVRLAPEAVPYRFTLAQALSDTNRPKEALEHYKSVLERDASYPDTYNNMGLIYRRLNDPEQAADCFEKALEKDARFVPALINMGLLKRDSGDLSAAAAFFDKALDAAPDNSEAAAQLAVCRRLQNRNEDALALYEKALSGAPADAGYLNGRGIVLERLGRNAEALESYNAAVKAAPRYADAYNNRANVLAKLGRHWDAEADFKTAVKIDPEYAEAYNNLGALLFEHERYEEALECYRKAFIINPKQAQTCNNLAMAVRAAGDLEEAIGLYFNALVLDPSEPAVKHNLARALYDLYAHEDKRRDAEKLARKWAEAYPEDPIARHLLASFEGRPIDRAAPRYVAELFDAFSETFDNTLDALSYNVPALIEKAVKGGKTGRRILDAGCGTGRCAPILRPYASGLSGVDLSEKMVQSAKNKGLYDDLTVQDLITYLSTRPASFDLIVLADVACYFGDLAPLTTAAGAALTDGGEILITLEKADEKETQDFVLRPTGRFAHTRAAAQTAIGLAGLSILSFDEETLRTENGAPVAGFFIKVQKIMGNPA